MSKMLTDSETLMRWIKPGVNPEDNPLCYMIKSLKDSVINAAILQTELSDDEQTETVRKMEAKMVSVLQELQDLRDDIGDLAS